MAVDGILAEFPKEKKSQKLDPVFGYARALNVHFRIIELCRQLELDGWAPDAIRAEMKPVRERLGEAAFIRHLQTWPHGYAGDWEIIEQLMDGENKSAQGTWAWYLEKAALDTVAAQQHSAKIQWQADRIYRTALSRTSHSRVLSFACGGGRDLQVALPYLAGRQPELVLNDMEPAALSLAERRTRAFTNRVTTLPGNVLHAARGLRNSIDFDLVIAGGLFDYLPDRVAILLLRFVQEHLLAPGGSMAFTNISMDNPCRPWMEYAVDWRLIGRTAADLYRICAEAGISGGQVTLQKDKTGLSWLIEVRHQG
jgi:extracellular factor (EF) 3-hydroxypalmitic acid methyl ester biosynthesis protein